METKLIDKKRKLLRKVYGVLSFSSALFVFQACYGTPQDMGLDVSIQGLVKSKTTNLPIAGIKVSIANQPQYEVTDSEGKFKIYASRDSSYALTFEDTVITQNGAYLSKDTVVKIKDETLFININLDVK